MIHVLSLVPYTVLPARFGGQKGIALFNKYFSTQVKLVCVTTQKNDPTAAEGYEVLNILSNSPLRYINPFYFFTLRKIIRQRKITHLLLEHPYYGWLGILLKKFTGVTLVVHSHNIEGLRWKMLNKWWWKILWRYERMTHRAANYNFFIHEQDAQYAIQHFSLQQERCAVITYGTEKSAPPSSGEKEAAREYLAAQHTIQPGHHILLFNGAFGYLPNLNGLQKIITEINPLLQQQPHFNYTIIICGSNIPDTITRQIYPDMIIAGLVDDIDMYFRGADVFINPVIEGGGIKTKIVEAIAFGCTVVSTESGAAGMNIAACGNKLRIIKNDNWHDFAAAVIDSAKSRAPVSPAYYDYYYWGNIVKKTAIIQQSN
jgi:glycosyltransferase involved in cell wall biosynthesis